VKLDDATLDRWRSEYSFRLEAMQRCDNCRHMKPLPFDGSFFCPPGGACKLLDIVIDSPLRSVCPGWQGSLQTRRERAMKQEA